MPAFGCDDKQAVKCLQVLIKAVDARALAKSRPDFIRTSMLTFFNNCADDLEKTIVNLHEGKYPHLRGTHMKTCTSFKYIFEIVVPVLTSTFDHLSGLDYGPDLLVDEVCDTFIFQRRTSKIIVVYISDSSGRVQNT